MNSKFALYVLDTETTHLDKEKGEIIELSMYRLNDDKQKTWLIKPTNYENISKDALRVNQHKIEDLRHETEYGRKMYLDPKLALPQIENFMATDYMCSEDRVLIAQNASFDIGFLQEFWKRHASIDVFPFGPRPKIQDTLQLALFMDIVSGERSQYYNLGSLVEKYGVKRLKAHRATEDTIMTKDVYLKQLASFSK